MEPIQITEEQERQLAERLNQLARLSNSPVRAIIAGGKLKFVTMPIPKWIEGNNANDSDHAAV